MSIIIEKLKGFITIHLFLMIVGVSLFAIFIEPKALEKKKLKKEANICKFIGYIYLIGGTIFFLVGKYVL